MSGHLPLTFNELAEKMGKALEAVPGVTFGFQYPVQMRFNELMTGARQDVVCKIFGENLDTLAYYANKLGNVINTVEGSANLYVEAVGGMPQIVIQYNRSSYCTIRIESFLRSIELLILPLQVKVQDKCMKMKKDLIWLFVWWVNNEKASVMFRIY
ncbi:MAG: efflux RND transporter permease subunit [Cytophagales bacterium]|nr:efflux RND transporter permease subunit [Cytophagales bacterium]